MTYPDKKFIVEISQLIKIWPKINQTFDHFLKLFFNGFLIDFRWILGGPTWGQHPPKFHQQINQKTDRPKKHGMARRLGESLIQSVELPSWLSLIHI